jgi:hypothetical protein
MTQQIQWYAEVLVKKEDIQHKDIPLRPTALSHRVVRENSTFLSWSLVIL